MFAHRVSNVPRTRANSNVRAYRRSPIRIFSYLKIRAYIHITLLHYGLQRVEFTQPKSRGAWNSSMYVCMCVCTVYLRARVIEHVYTRVFARLYRYVFPVSLLQHVSPSLLPARRQFSFHVPPTIQFIRRIIPGNVEGTEGCFQPSPFLFYLVVALQSDLLFLRACIDHC